MGPLDSHGRTVIHQLRKMAVMGNLACLGYIKYVGQGLGDEKLPGYEGIIVNHFKNPYQTNGKYEVF